MSTLVADRIVADGAASSGRPFDERWPSPAGQRALLTLAVGLMIVVGRDGSPIWQIVRIAVVAALTLFASRVLRSGIGGWRAGIAFSVGLTGTAVGTGIGIPHLVKNGLHPLTVAGLVTLGSGLVLLASGGLSLVRRARPWRRVLVVPMLLAAVFVVMWSLGQAVAVTNAPRSSVGDTTPADVGLPYRDVEFGTSDGVTLSGWYIPTTNGAAVVLLHGSGSTRASVLDQALVLAGHGYGVLMFDARGHGGSGGRAMALGWHGDQDTSAAVTFLQSQPDVDGGRIAAVGMSMGGEEAIGAAAADGRIQAVIAEGATNRVSGDKAWLSDEYGWRGMLQEGVEWLTYGLADLLTAADPPIALRDAVAAVAPRPVLLIAAGDVESEGLAGRHIAGASPDTVELWIVPGTGHTAGLDTHPDEWAQRVTTFLDRALGG
jgi:fermentation-respiration switch protein FrsA (DUF1100 family)